MSENLVYTAAQDTAGAAFVFDKLPLELAFQGFAEIVPLYEDLSLGIALDLLFELTLLGSLLGLGIARITLRVPDALLGFTLLPALLMAAALAVQSRYRLDARFTAPR